MADASIGSSSRNRWRRAYATSTTSTSSSARPPSTSSNSSPLSSSSSSSSFPKDSRTAGSSSNPSSSPSPSAIIKPRIRTQHELYNVSSRSKRLVLHNDETAKMLVDAMHLEATPNLVVIDLYAGQGALSKHVLELPNVTQVVGVEDAQVFTPQLHEMIEHSAGRFAQVALDPYWWDAYRVIQEKGLLNAVKKTDWMTGMTNLAMIGMMPGNIHGEQLVVQQITCIATQMWLYQYGRFSMYYLVPKKYAERIMAPPGSKDRRKLAVILQALAQIEQLVPSESLQPIKEHFKPLRSKSAGSTAWTLIKVTPHKQKKIIESLDDLEILEFLTRNMFVHPSSRWVDILKYLAPGATILKDMIHDTGYTISAKKKARDLTTEDWVALLKAFKEWPFRPEDLDQDDVRNAQEEEE